MPPQLTPEQRAAAAEQARLTRASKKIQVVPEEMTFGIEIECYIPHASLADFDISVGNYHSGHQLPTRWFPSGWKAESDGSLTDAPHGMRGVEIVSPVLHGSDGLRQVLEVVNLIRKSRSDGGLGGKVTRKCGQHVHVGMKSVLGSKSNDLTVVSEWVRRLLHLAAKHEAALYATTGWQSRIDYEYCESIKRTWNGKVGKHLAYNVIQRESQLMNSRRRVVNVNHLFDSKKTVEFRVFAGTLTAKKSIGYIMTALAFCHKAAENISVAAWDADPVAKTSDAQYYVAAVKHMHDRLAWMDARAKYGWWDDAWRHYGKLVKENQLWNANRMATDSGD